MLNFKFLGKENYRTIKWLTHTVRKLVSKSESFIESGLPKDFFIATTVNNNKLIYKTDKYREIDLAKILNIPVSNSNEIIRIDNDLYVTINYTFDGSKDQDIIRLENCYIVDNILKVSKVHRKSPGLKSVHSLVYNPSDNFIYAADRTYGERVGKIIKICPYTLNTVKTSNFPNTPMFTYSTTDIKIYNNKLYILVGALQNLRLLEVSTNLEDYTEIYTGTTNPSIKHDSAQPFVIYNGKAYITAYDTVNNATKNIKIIEINLVSKIIRVSANILINNTSNGYCGTHWMTVYNDKIFVSIYAYGNPKYYSSLCRIDIKTLTKEDEKTVDFPTTDDNSIVNGYIHLNGESFFKANWVESYPQYPKNNAKLLKINPFNFTDFSEELSPYNSGYGSYGSINYDNDTTTIQLDTIRTLINS